MKVLGRSLRGGLAGRMASLLPNDITEPRYHFDLPQVAHSRRAQIARQRGSNLNFEALFANLQQTRSAEGFNSQIATRIFSCILSGPEKGVITKGVFSLEESLDSLKSPASLESLENGHILLCFP